MLSFFGKKQTALISPSDIEFLNDNDGLFIEVIDNTNGCTEVVITHDQYMSQQEVLDLIPKKWINLEKQNKLKVSLSSAYIPTYEIFRDLKLRVVR
jgi:hypothetical protein